MLAGESERPSSLCQLLLHVKHGNKQACFSFGGCRTRQFLRGLVLSEVLDVSSRKQDGVVCGVEVLVAQHTQVAALAGWDARGA